jgi:glutaredoxin-like YruB-family protein
MKKVSIYTTPTCHFCHMAKDFFTEKGIKYEEYNVASDADKRAEMIDITGQMGVPVIQIDNDVIIGFNKPKIAELLGVS